MSTTSYKRRAFTAEFKAQVVLSLLSGLNTQAELCREHQLSPNVLAQWKDTFLKNAAAVFHGLPPFYVPVNALVPASFFASSAPSAARRAANSAGVWYPRLECRRSSL